MTFVAKIEIKIILLKNVYGNGNNIKRAADFYVPSVTLYNKFSKIVVELLYCNLSDLFGPNMLIPPS